MKRHHQILVGILACQMVLSLIVFWPRSATTGGGQPLFPDLGVEDIVGLTVEDADGNSIVLRQVGEDWVLPEVDDYPADAESITPVLENLVALTTNRLVTRTAASHKRLQVSADDFVRRLELETADGPKHTIYLGSSPRYGATHFRVDGQNETYLTDEISTWEMGADAGAWIDKSYVSVPDEEVTKMTLENANGSFSFSKDDEDNWTMAGMATGERLDEAKVTGLIRQVASLNMIRPEGKEESPAYDMDQPNGVITLETDERSVTLRVGAEDPDDESYVVISSESEYYVRVSKFSVDDVVERAREDFLQPPPTPTPEGEIGPP